MLKFLTAKWQNIIMANYEVPPAVLEKYLPKGVELDLYNGKDYMSLVGFKFAKIRIFKIPIPFLGTFEEINLRFYVKQKVNNEIHKGVVFINETIPYKAVAWLANNLYKEHYVTIPTKHHWDITTLQKKISYSWLVNKKWNNMQVTAKNTGSQMLSTSFEYFIFEHYLGYTKVNETTTEKYYISHPSWLINEVTSENITCNFEDNYGSDFAFLNKVPPTAVFLAEGSDIGIAWKRNKI